MSMFLICLLYNNACYASAHIAYKITLNNVFLKLSSSYGLSSKCNNMVTYQPNKISPSYGLSPKSNNTVTYQSYIHYTVRSRMFLFKYS